MNGQAILENVRRYRAIASLHRQTAAFRPHWALVAAGAGQRAIRALAELEVEFMAAIITGAAPKCPARN